MKTRENAPYPGLEAFTDRNWENTINKIKQYIPETCYTEHTQYTPYPQGKFHLAIEKDLQTRTVGVHVDIPR